jgi:nitrate reductase NapE component
MFKTFYKNRKSISKRLWIFFFCALLLLIILGVTVFPYWVGLLAFIAWMFLLFGVTPR